MLQILKSSRAVLLVWAVILGTFFVGKATFLTPFSPEQQYTLLVLVIAIYLWTLSMMPQGASSILVLALLIGLGVVDEPDQAFQGFLTTGLYFIVLLSLISQVLVIVGFDQVIARLFQQFSGGRVSRLVVSLPIMMVLLPIILPSAVARYKILEPLIKRMNDLNGFSNESVFNKFGLFVISFLNQKGTFIVFTGGGFAVIAYQLMVEYNVAQIQWLEWMGLMAPPLFVITLFSSIFVWFYFKWKTGEESNVQIEVPNHHLEEKQVEHPKFWYVVFAFLAMVVAWIATDPTVVPIILPPMLMVAFLAIPAIGLVNNQLIRNFDWETFLLLGTSFSLGFIMAENGTAEMIATALIQLVPDGASTWMKVIFIILFIGIMRWMFTNSTSAIVVIFPIMMSYASLIDLSPVALALLIMTVIGGTILIPIHAPTTYYASLAGVYTKGEQFVVGIISSTVATVVALLAVFLYW
ncbi:SLC13 family permease [Alkalibacillus haloalkaliphilus]|uniref:SLC13 family permease n=1 Tax=Alkalibacillus haloalkaliphilus TaxID=94136 RepID=UPI002936C4C9|nr:SLC13 family permease [Alkalibacillus haloalkaliphilus]MDV2581416.1 anion permease [Alkalibacillus haloalkaliphilus]